MPALVLTASNGVVANFLTAKTVQGGFLFKIPQIHAETLETPGVDGRRWRQINRQMQPATLECVADAATTWSNAVALADNFRALAGQFVTAVYTAGGVGYKYKNVYVANVEATPIAGALVGSEASSYSAYHVRATVVLETTDFTALAT